MAENCRCVLPVVIATVNVRDRNSCQFLVREIVEAHHVYSVHLANWRVVPDTESTYAAVLAEIVVVLLGVEHVLG